MCFSDNNKTDAVQKAKKRATVHFEKIKYVWKFDAAIIPPLKDLLEGEISIYSYDDKNLIRIKVLIN